MDGCEWRNITRIQRKLIIIIYFFYFILNNRCPKNNRNGYSPSTDKNMFIYFESLMPYSNTLVLWINKAFQSFRYHFFLNFKKVSLYTFFDWEHTKITYNYLICALYFTLKKLSQNFRQIVKGRFFPIHKLTHYSCYFSYKRFYLVVLCV